MSTFSPDVPPIPRADPADVLAKFVPAALRRTPPVARFWRMPKLVLLGVVTGGFLPCRALHVRLRQTLMMHADQCSMASQLIEKHLPADDAKPVTDAGRRVAVSHAWLDVAAALMLVALGLAVYWLATYHGRHGLEQFFLHAPRPLDSVAWLSVGLLSAAYLLQIVQMNQQVIAMQQFAFAVNAACDERFAAIEPPMLVWGTRPVPLVLGLGFAIAGLIWGLPMMLAWAAFSTFAGDSARRFRVDLADRLVTLTGTEPVVPTADLCPNPSCRNSLPVDAIFCPRCGAALGPRAAG